MTDPPPRLCERCYSLCVDGEQFVRLGHIVGSTLRGDITWAYTYLHHYERDEGCTPTKGDP